jgi:hypothetical protein
MKGAWISEGNSAVSMPEGISTRRPRQNHRASGVDCRDNGAVVATVAPDPQPTLGFTISRAPKMDTQTSTPMLNPFTRTCYHDDRQLITWYPDGVLDFELAAMMVQFMAFQERVIDQPFDRFADWSKVFNIQLNFRDVSDFAAERRAAYGAGPPVKSAFLATNPAAYGIARMFSTLMDPSPIEVRVFRELDPAAEWLEVPADILRLH